jgi:hypothetical protein
MMGRLHTLLLLVVAIAGTATADTPKDPYAGWREPIVKIVGASYDGRVHAQLDELTELGSRLSGSRGYGKAVDWAVVQLKAAGVQNVHVENATLEHGWQRGTTRGSITAPITRPLRVETIGWSPSTPPGGVRGLVIPIRVDALPPAKELKGKVGLVDLSLLPEGPDGGIAMHKGVAALYQAGMLAVLFQNPLPNNVVGTGNVLYGGRLVPLPIAEIGHEDGRLLARELVRGPVTVELAITNTITGPVKVASVIGELVGRERPAEWLLVGGHLDSWDFATGAQDNGTGVVQVIQTARLLGSAGPLRRTVRFALWGAEEQGLVGSYAYTLAHASELADCVAVLNTDNGAGHVRGWKVQKRKDVQAALEPFATHLLADLGAATVDMAMTSDTDHFSFVQAGVPALDLLVDMTDYWTAHHMVADTIDKVDRHALASGLAVVAVTAYAIASSPDRFARRLERAPTEELIKKAGSFDEQLRLWGWWK